jgi:hypothetical protein
MNVAVASAASATCVASFRLDDQSRVWIALQPGSVLPDTDDVCTRQEAGALAMTARDRV